MKRSDIYKAIRDQAKANMPGLKYIDLDKGQLQRKKDDYPFPLPALLIKFSAIRWSSASEGLQLGELTISLYLHENMVTDSFHGAAMENETIALLDRQDDIFQAFEDFCIEDMSPLVRVTDQELKPDIRAIVFSTDFKTTITDRKTIIRKTVSKPKIVIE